MTKPEQSNQDFAWARFDPEAYVEHYYGDPHPDDDRAVAMTCRALARLGRADLDVIDVGTGPNLFPLFAALPVAKSVTVWEYAQSNIDWMRRELDGGVLREPWTHFWNVARDAHGAAVDNPITELAEKTKLVQGSIFHLPQRRWDAATMFFCAESITERQDEFERACAAFARAVRPGGVLAAAFLAGSRGYEVAGEAYPAVSVTVESVAHAFSSLAREIEVAPIGAMGEEIRSGYTGMLFLSAKAI